MFPKTETIKSHNSRTGSPFNVNSASKKMITEVGSLHIQLIGTIVWLPKNAQCSSRNGFWIFEISREVRVLKQSQSALFSSISHMTILFVFTCMMNVWNQSIQAFVTCFWSMFRWIVQVYSLTIKYQVFQSVSSINILDEFESILATILQHISSSLKWSSSMHRVDTL